MNPRVLYSVIASVFIEDILVVVSCPANSKYAHAERFLFLRTNENSVIYDCPDMLFLDMESFTNALDLFPMSTGKKKSER